ncbi:type II CRISPR-associated endonuclease Cas1 [Caryophanon latum]|uniref:CRISPR-associated endonuclease Cas1 n=1 Tax=Caryophanon latum TaxID=33977 RepID=A0A1C0YPL2_9BACL|nr:type II CRISPR-associated endonuclease Cas1 [Caryophanon latum]OCS89019.1 subtype II CRISPR-associated endonuclease Cas1 [Caryophanon latum]
MSWRTVILTKESKLSLRMKHLVISNDTVTKIPLSEIAVVIIENPNIVLTGHIINALSNYKITAIICDDKMNPASNIQAIYGHHRQSKHIRAQFEWLSERKALLWQQIIRQKIYNQAKVLHALNKEGVEELQRFISQVAVADRTNREGHAAKVYFNRLYGNDFYRNQEIPINWALNYGYMILHSLFARLIVSKGYLTELGIHHMNEYNQMNLASDFVEVFRPLVDYFVYMHISDTFNKEDKRNIIAMLDYKIVIRNAKQHLQSCMQIYLDSCIQYLQDGDIEKLHFPDFQYKL